MAQIHDLSTDTKCGDLIFAYNGPGLTSRQTISVEVFQSLPGTGIVFSLNTDGDGATKDKQRRCSATERPEEGCEVKRVKSGGAEGTEGDGATKKRLEIPAKASFVVNTLRNVVLGLDKARLCLVEHFLAAVALWGATDLLVHVDGPELPMGDGSARLWLDLFEKSGLPRQIIESTITLKEPIIIKKGEKQLIALPAEKFSITYLMNWQHPAIGKCWQTWTNTDPPTDIGYARTFGSQKEHELLGLKDDVVSLTAEGFSKPLLFEDEPVRHKLLDLLGDLTLSGVNPQLIKAQFISVVAGHELDVKMAQQLSSLMSKT